MGYIIGGKSRLITAGVEEEYKSLTSPASVNFASVPNISPSKSYSNLSKSGERALKTAGYLDTQRTAPLFNDPRYTSSTLAIPSDSRSLNGLYRYFTETDPIVGSAIKLHTDLPLANLRLGSCEDSGVQQHYEEMWDKLNGLKVLTDAVSEFYEIGDAFLFGAFNESEYMWEQFAILNPDYVKVEGTWVNSKPLIKLIPDEALKKIVSTRTPKFLYDQLPPEIIKYVLYNSEIPLDSNNVFHLSHAKRPYELRGRSLIKRILKVLMLEDRFNQANFALASRHAVPLTVVKVGDPQSVEEDHLITYKENEELKVCSFADFWNTYSGKVTQYEDKEVKYVGHHNLYVQAVNNKGENVWNLVENILRHPTPEEIVKVITPHGSIRSTLGHGFVRLNPDTLEMEAVTPEVLENFPDSTIVTMNKFDYSLDDTTVFDIPLSDNLAYVIGLWTGNGYVNENDSTNIVISNSDKGIQDYLLTLPTRLQTVVSKVITKKYKDGCVITVIAPSLNKGLFQLYNFKDDFKKAGKEIVPNSILFNTSDEITGAFLAGVIDGDGQVCEDAVIVSRGLSKEYHHLLSLALLSKGITSCIHSSFEGCYELFVSEAENLKKLYSLVLPYIQHSKKKEELIKQKLKIVSTVHPLQDMNEMLQLFNNLILSMFLGKEIKDLKSFTNKPTLPSKRKYGSKNTTEKYVLDCEEEDRLLNFYEVKIDKIQKVNKSSSYVYDLMLKDEPHCYLVGNDGWVLTHNSGWVPSNEELDQVRDMIAAYELDPNFSIIYHYGINVDYYGSNGKMLPVGPELDRLYRLKFVGLQVHEQLLAGQSGSYSQAYINLEVQRQRYLNLQLKLENMVHIGWFKTVADLCGFYRVKQSIVGFGRTSSYKYGDPIDSSHLSKVFSGLRDYQDNQEFQEFLQKKAQETPHLVREYVYPKLDWGGMNASSDENLKNYIKWLSEKRPWLVDDATLARLAKLDRDTQEKSFIEDVKRDAARMQQLAKDGNLNFARMRSKIFGGGGGEGFDLGGMSDFGGGDIPLAGASVGGPEEGGMPPAPIGENGPPAAATGIFPIDDSGNTVASSLKFFENNLKDTVAGDDVYIASENTALQNMKKYEQYAILREIEK